MWDPAAFVFLTVTPSHGTHGVEKAQGGKLISLCVSPSLSSLQLPAAPMGLLPSSCFFTLGLRGDHSWSSVSASLLTLEPGLLSPGQVFIPFVPLTLPPHLRFCSQVHTASFCCCFRVTSECQLLLFMRLLIVSENQGVTLHPPETDTNAFNPVKISSEK